MRYSTDWRSRNKFKLFYRKKSDGKYTLNIQRKKPSSSGEVSIDSLLTNHTEKLLFDHIKLFFETEKQDYLRTKYNELQQAKIERIEREERDKERRKRDRKAKETEIYREAKETETKETEIGEEKDIEKRPVTGRKRASNRSYKEKYLKYKAKYLELKKKLESQNL
jgi:hypothetical protein